MRVYINTGKSKDKHQDQNISILETVPALVGIGMESLPCVSSKNQKVRSAKLNYFGMLLNFKMFGSLWV